MGGKQFLLGILTILLVAMLILYWFIPYGKITDFSIGEKNYNFTLDNYDETGMQFYKNMRYQYSKISYNIDNCTLQKISDMETAFQIIENTTLLEFNELEEDGEIEVTCDSKNKMDGDFFIAGEGGPVEIAQTPNFNIISKGKILLIKDSQCERPNVAIHELLHALGFAHSSNKNNIMYNYSKCSQTIGDDIPLLINKLYSVSSYSDLTFEDVNASMDGKYLNTNISIRNYGLIESQEAILKIYADDKEIKEMRLDSLDFGEGSLIILTNVWISQLNVNELKYEIIYNHTELNKDNNFFILEIKK